MRKLISYIIILAALASCQKDVVSPVGNGMISFSLDNSPEFEVVTKAEGEAVSMDNFRVYVQSASMTYPYFYSELENRTIVVPIGMYTISAENVSEEVSLSQPDVWGQVRYAGTTEAKEVKADGTTTRFELTCSIVNTALSVTFDELITKRFENYQVTAYTDEDRKLVYDASNTTGASPAVGYFSPKTLHYEFTGLFVVDENEKTPISVKGTKELLPKTKLDLGFKLSLKNGSIDLEIIVDNSYTTDSETVTIEPEK